MKPETKRVLRESSLADLTGERSDRILYSLPGLAPSVVTTMSPNGSVNVGVFEQTMICSHFPPVILLALSHKTDTLHNLRDHGECVIGFPYPWAAQLVYDAGARLPRGESELDLIDFDVEPAVSVEPPRLAQCWLSAEGRLEWEKDTGDHGLCAIEISHVGMDAAYWRDDYKDRRRALPSLYYATAGAFFTAGESIDVAKSDSVARHERMGRTD
jgi:flavin reductase (DIM6/NTAB) family NADH-FMN oxidoreductase RutF